MKGIWPFRHIGLKLWSVVLAVFLWLVVAGEETVERGLRVPLELQQVPAGLELQGEPPALVDIRVRGSSGMLGRLSAGDVVAVLDVRAARPGRRLFQLSPDQVRVPFGLQVLQVSPSNLTLTFENTAKRRVPVAVALEGEPAPGFIVGATSVEPKVVEVVGPESAVERVTEAITEPVVVAGATADVTESVAIGLLDPSLRLAASQMAAVKIEILPGPEERELVGHPIHLRGTGTGLVARAIPVAADVVLRGSKSSLSRVDPEHVTLYVDVTGLGPGEYNLGVHADASADAGVARINPATVQVRITSVK